MMTLTSALLAAKHDAAASLRAVEAAAATGQRVSLDIIYAREGQSVEAWRAELGQALTLPIEHASLYQLTVEPGTAFARRVDRHQLTPPNDDLSAELYEATQESVTLRAFRRMKSQTTRARVPRVHVTTRFTGRAAIGLASVLARTDVSATMANASRLRRKSGPLTTSKR
jgi:hypothetical protein